MRRPSPSSPNGSRRNLPSATSRPSKPLTVIGQPLPPPRTGVTSRRRVRRHVADRQSRSAVRRGRTASGRGARSRRRHASRRNSKIITVTGDSDRSNNRNSRLPQRPDTLREGHRGTSFSRARAIARAASVASWGWRSNWAFVVIVHPSDVERESIEDLVDLFVREVGLTVLM